MKYFIAQACLLLTATVAFPAQSPSLFKDPFVPAPVVSTTVTDHELELTARYEDLPLFLGQQQVSVLHYPGNASHAAACSVRGCGNGCTIGFGYNIGPRTASRVKAELTPIIGAAQAAVFARYAGLTGQAAFDVCNSRVSDLPTLSRGDALRLLQYTVASHKQQVLNRINSEGLRGVLNPKQVAVLVALDYQNPRLSSRATQLWRHLHAGEFEQIAQNIQHRSGTRHLAALQTRRNQEAKLWRQASGL